MKSICTDAARTLVRSARVFFRKKPELLKQRVIFIHIPKAAGTTLRKIVRRQYSEHRVWEHSSPVDLSEYRRLKTSSEGELLKHSVIMGHIPYLGPHELFDAFVPITMLRDPVDRVISAYRYAYRTPGHYLHGEIRKGKLDLMAYIDSAVDPMVDNCQTRYLSGDEDAVEQIVGHGRTGGNSVVGTCAKGAVAVGLPYGACTSAHLDVAKRNISQMAAFGLQEQFDSSLALFWEYLNWDIPVYRPFNVAPADSWSQAPGREVIARIQAVNRFDSELYSYAQSRFFLQFSRRRVNVTTRVAALRLANRLYSTCLPGAA